MSKFPTIVTHNGAFHADDIIGVAILMQLFDNPRLVRTRDPEVIAAANFAVDVGGIWNPDEGRYDHHQKGFEGKRANGTVYASAGLVWQDRGKGFIRSVTGARGQHLSADLVDKVFEGVDRELMEHVDRADTGADRGAPDYFGLTALLDTFNLTRDEEVRWGEGVSADERPRLLAQVRQDHFLEAVRFVHRLLCRLVIQLAARYADAEVVRSSERLEDGKVLVLQHSGLIWEDVVINEMPEVLFVVYPDSTDVQYQVRTVPVAVGSFQARKDLPAAWAGLRDTALSAVVGIPDAVFCHNGRFIGGAGSKASALKMAQLALQA